MAPWWHPGGTLATWHAAAPGELGGLSAPICCHKSRLRASRRLPHCWGEPGALQQRPGSSGTEGTRPLSRPPDHRDSLAGCWREAGPELASAPHTGGASGEEQGNAGCLRCGDSTVPPSTGQPSSTATLFVCLQQLHPFGASGAHPSPREQKSAIDLQVPLPITPRHGEREKRIDICGRLTSTDGQTDTLTVHRAGEMGGSAPPPCQPSPRSQRCTVTAPRRPRTRALARQTAPATQPTHAGGTEPQHNPPFPSLPIPIPGLAWRSRKARVRTAPPAHGVPGATSLRGESEL